MTPTTRARRLLPTRSGAIGAIGAVALLTLVGACSSGTDAPEAAPAASPGTDQDPAAGAGPGRGPGGGTSGEIAAVADALMQVQGDDGQTAVTWDSGTTITQTVAAALSDVTVGSCVVVLGAGDDAAATGVAVSTPVDGVCTGGFGGGAGDGAGPSGMPSGMPDMPADGERPDGAPTGMPGDVDGMLPGGGLTAGLVTAVSGSTITVESTGVPGGDDAAEGDAATTTVTVDDATTYTTTAAADASALTVGRCVLAQGEADDSGQVAATSLTVSDPGDDGCTSGFAGGQGMPGRPGADDDEEAAGA